MFHAACHNCCTDVAYRLTDEEITKLFSSKKATVHGSAFIKQSTGKTARRTKAKGVKKPVELESECDSDDAEALMGAPS